MVLDFFGGEDGVFLSTLLVLSAGHFALFLLDVDMLLDWVEGLFGGEVVLAARSGSTEMYCRTDVTQDDFANQGVFGVFCLGLWSQAGRGDHGPSAICQCASGHGRRGLRRSGQKE